MTSRVKLRSIFLGIFFCVSINRFIWVLKKSSFVSQLFKYYIYMGPYHVKLNFTFCSSCIPVQSFLKEANQVHSTSQYIYFSFSTCFRQLCAHHQEKLLHLCDTGLFFTLYGWLSVLLVGMRLIPTNRDRQPPMQI